MFYSNLIDWDQVTYDSTEKFVPPISYKQTLQGYEKTQP